MLPTLMIRAGSSAVPAASSSGRNARTRKNGALRFRLTSLSQADSGNSSNGAPQAAPALLTRMSSLSSRAANAAASALQPATVATSCGSGMQAGPSSAAVSSQPDALREEM